MLVIWGYARKYPLLWGGYLFAFCDDIEMVSLLFLTQNGIITKISVGVYLLNSLIAWFQQLNFSVLLDLLLLAAASVLCITVHETCHGLMALALGDDTAKRQGRLSLNPLRHIDPLGLVMLTFLRFGWARPVPVDMRKFRNPKLGMMLTALAGPVSNVLLAFFFLLIRTVLLVVVPFEDMKTVFHYFLGFLEYVVLISTGLAVFNLFPIPPLDGSKVLFSVLPERWYRQLMRYEKYGMLLLVVLLFTNILDVPLLFLRTSLLDGLQALVEPIYLFISLYLV